MLEISKSSETGCNEIQRTPSLGVGGNGRTERSLLQRSHCPLPLQIFDSVRRTEPIWHKTNTNRARAIHLLQNKPQGSFLVRDVVEDGATAMTLSTVETIAPALKVQHHPIHFTDGLGFHLQNSQQCFSNLAELVSYYCSNKNSEGPHLILSEETAKAMIQEKQQQFGTSRIIRNHSVGTCSGVTCSGMTYSEAMPSGMTRNGVTCSEMTDFRRFHHSKATKEITESRKTVKTESEFTKFTQTTSTQPLNHFPESVKFSFENGNVASNRQNSHQNANSSRTAATPSEIVLGVLPSDEDSSSNSGFSGNGIVYYNSGLTEKLSDYEDIWPSSASTLDISPMEAISNPDLDAIKDPIYQNVNRLSPHQQVREFVEAVDTTQYQLGTSRLDDRIDPKSNCSSYFPIYQYTIDYKLRSQNINSNSTAYEMQMQNINSNSSTCKIQSQNINSKSSTCKIQSQNINSNSSMCKIQSQNINSNSTACEMQTQNVNSNYAACKIKLTNVDSQTTNLLKVVSKHVRNGFRPNSKQTPSVFQFDVRREERSTCETIESQKSKHSQNDDVPSSTAVFGLLPDSYRPSPGYALPCDALFGRVETARSSVKALGGGGGSDVLREVVERRPHLPESHSVGSFPQSTTISSSSFDRRSIDASSAKRFVPKFLQKTNGLRYSPIEDKNSGDDAPSTRGSCESGLGRNELRRECIGSFGNPVSKADDEYKQPQDTLLLPACVPPVSSSSCRGDAGQSLPPSGHHHHQSEGNDVWCQGVAAAAEPRSTFVRKESKSRVELIRQSISEIGRKVRRRSLRRSKTTQGVIVVGDVCGPPTQPKSVDPSRGNVSNENSLVLTLEIPAIDITQAETETETAEDFGRFQSSSRPLPNLFLSVRNPRRNSAYDNVDDDDDDSSMPDRSERRMTASSRVTNVSASTQYCQPWESTTVRWSRFADADSTDSFPDFDALWKHEKFPRDVPSPLPPPPASHLYADYDYDSSILRSNSRNSDVVACRKNDSDDDFLRVERSRATALESMTDEHNVMIDENSSIRPLRTSENLTTAIFCSDINDVLCGSRYSDAECDSRKEFCGTRCNVLSSYSSQIVGFSCSGDSHAQVQTARTEYENTFDWSASATAAAAASGTVVSKASSSQKRNNDNRYVLQSSPDVIPLTAAPRLISQTNRGHELTGARICYHVVSLSNRSELFFGNIVRNFIDCTITGSETNPQRVVRNVRQFMDGMKNYLTHEGEDHLNVFIEAECSRMNSFEFLNLDAILERALQKCVVKPLHEHIHKLFVYDYTRNGNLEKMSQSLKLAKTQTVQDIVGMLRQLVPSRKGTIVSALHFLNLMEKTYSPLKKLENLLAAVRALGPTFHHRDRTSGCDDTLNSTNRATKLKADELLSTLICAMIQKGLLSAEIEADYMRGLIQPTFLTGENSFYLNLFSSAVALIKTLGGKLETMNNDNNVNDDNNNTGLFKDGLLSIVVPDEKHDRAILVNVPVHPHITSREMCNMTAYMLGVTNPQDYGLFAVNAEVETRLDDSRSISMSSLPLVAHDQRHGFKNNHQFMYKRLSAKFVWPKDFNR